MTPRTNASLKNGAMRLKRCAQDFLQIVRDPSSIAIAFLMPLFLLLLFGHGVSADADHVPIAFVAEQPSRRTPAISEPACSVAISSP